MPISKRSIAWLCNVKFKYTAITAAIDGQVSKIDIQPGQLVQPGQSLLYHQQQWSLGCSQF
jgi:membrane fusion protein (multidrug efflux system)